MRQKTIIMILAVVLTLILGAFGFMAGMIMSGNKQGISTQMDNQMSITQVESEIEMITEETLMTADADSGIITNIDTATNYNSAITQTEKSIDVSYYKNYYPEIDQFVYNGIVATQSSHLSLRSLPIENAEILASIPKGEELPIYRTDVDGWYWTSYRRIHGYVCSEYINKSNGQQLEPADYAERQYPDPESVPAFAPSSTTFLFRGYVATQSDPLNLRADADSKSVSIIKIPKGTELDIYSCGEADWYWTEYNGKHGYVSSKYIRQVQQQTPEPAEAETSISDLSKEFRAIVSREGSPVNTGYYTDVNGDGCCELILKNPKDMNFHMYSYGSDGEIHETYFGAYKSMNEAKLFRVPAANGKYYFYWRCEYMLYSIQGYYDPLTNSEIDIGVNYNFDDHSEWILFFNNNEYASGREEGASTYGATPNCYQKLLMMFQDYGFQIYDNSDYTKLECLDQKELLNAIR